jgi:hypothetical protein
VTWQCGKTKVRLSKFAVHDYELTIGNKTYDTLETKRFKQSVEEHENTYTYNATLDGKTCSKGVVETLDY